MIRFPFPALSNHSGLRTMVDAASEITSFFCLLFFRPTTALSNSSNLNYETVTDSSGSPRDVKVRLDLNALLCDITTTAGAPWLKIMRKEFGSETFNR